jgi:hypothetical protein
MSQRTRALLRHPVEYDAVRRRVWILGQRCHHGATGALLASAGATTLILAGGGLSARGSVALAAGGVLMAHDWKDRGLWFRPGYGTQP